MSERTLEKTLNRLVGEAVCNHRFCAALLDGQREEVIRPFGLTAEAREYVLAIEASSLQEFAMALEQWLETRRADTVSLPWGTDYAVPFAPGFATAG